MKRNFGRFIFIPLNTNLVKKNSKNFKDSKDRQMLKFEEILPKIHRMQILRKLAPSCPRLLAPLAPLGINHFLGGFWHLSQLKVEEISPKIPRMQILRKLAPLLPPVYSPPWPPWGSKKMWEVSGI